MTAYSKRITAGVPGVRAAGQSVWVNQPSVATLTDGVDFDAWEQALYDMKMQAVNARADYGLAGDNATDDTAGVQAVIDDTVAASRKILHLPYGQYKITSTLDVSGGASNQPLVIEGSTAPQSATGLFRHFDGPLMNVRNSLIMRNITLWDPQTTAEQAASPRSGAAIQMLATSTQRANFCVFDSVRISSAAEGGAWERIIDADGSLYGTTGNRDIIWNNCYFFGARTAGQTIRVNRGTNWWFANCHMSAAPLIPTVRAGIQILDATYSDTFLFTNCDWGADFESAAANTYFVGKMIYTNVPVLTGANSHIFTHEGIHFASGATSARNTSFRGSGEAGDRLRIRNDGAMFGGDGTGTLWKSLTPTVYGWLHNGRFGAPTDGLTTKAKAGIPDDADWATAPPDGTIVADTTNNRVYVRVGGTWRYAALT